MTNAERKIIKVAKKEQSWVKRLFKSNGNTPATRRRVLKAINKGKRR